MLTCCLHEFCMIQNAQHTQLGQQFLLASYCAPIFGQWHATCISFLAPNGSGSYSICEFNGEILSIPKIKAKKLFEGIYNALYFYNIICKNNFRSWKTPITLKSTVLKFGAI